MGNILRCLSGQCCQSSTAPQGVPSGVSALAHDISNLKPILRYKKLLVAWREAKPPPRTPAEVSTLVIQNLKEHQKADVQGLLAFYGLPLLLPLPLPHLVVQPSAASWAKFELHTLPVDIKAVADGDTVTVYVSTKDPRESYCVPKEVQTAAIQRSKARAQKNYAKADELHKKIVDNGYRMLNVQNEEVLGRKYRIRLRGIDAPKSLMPFGQEAKEELVKLVQGKSLKVPSMMKTGMAGVWVMHFAMAQSYRKCC